MEHTKLSEAIVKQLEARFEQDDFKAFVDATTKASDEDSGTFEVVITTENVDRMGEVIKSDGWDIDNYMKNPVVLWGHDHYALPIGVCTSIDKQDGKLIAKGKFAPEDANPQGQHCRRLYDLGILRATSVGFIEKEREGNLITKAELLEFSFVSVPANPMALSTLIKSNLSINELVTKGFISIKEEEPAPVDTTPDPVDTPADPVADPVTDPIADPVVDPVTDPEPVVDPVEDPVIGDDTEKAIANAITALKDSISVLEAVATKGNKPEHKEEPETAEAKSFRLFTESRKLMQAASAALSESLAEARKAVDAKLQ